VHPPPAVSVGGAGGVVVIVVGVCVLHECVWFWLSLLVLLVLFFVLIFCFN
jgi:hypothetical protein